METDVYRAIADPTRRRMLDMLVEHERTVSDLMQPFRMTQPAVSKHLRVLREAGLVTERRDGRHRRYRLSPKPLFEVAAWLEHYRSFWRDRLQALATLLDEETP